MSVRTAISDEACPCGSGLIQKKCCGFDYRGVAIVPPEAHAAQLTALTHAFHVGDHGEARRLALAVLDAAPAQRDALGALFNILRDAGEINAAAAVVHRLALVHANDAVSRSVAVQFFLAHNDILHAQLHARMLVRLAPQEPVAQALMGRVFLASGNAKAAEYHLLQALALIPSADRHAGKPADPQVEASLAMALRDQGRFDPARAMFERLAQADGARLAVLLAWAELEESARDFAAAFALLDRAAAGDMQVAAARAGLHRRVGEPERALAAIATVKRADGGDGDLLRKGQILDSLGRYDEAFESFATFKARQRAAGVQYRAEQAERLVSALTGFFTVGRARLLPRAERRADSAQPIFIVGFPRSGTTLVEQTLTAHPNISAGDELPFINSIVQRAQALLGSPGPYPTALSELWLGDRRAQIDTLRDLYLNDAAAIGAIVPGKPWFTDKMPLNETHLGLISLLFPQSPILHLVRHPLDVVLSVFSNGLTHGFHCANALDTAAQHYALIANLIAHYRATLPLNYHAVRYEDLVDDQERVVRDMLGFIGEPFDARTLAFHENARPARTASYAQVTERLYDRSRYRYRNYLTHLAPVIPILEPAITRLDYTIEGR